MFLNRESSIQETLDFSFAVIELVLGNALGMNTRLVDHAPRSMLEVRIILEKVGMAEDVGSNKGILKEIIHLHQEGIAWIGVDHHLVDFAQAEVILHLLPIVGFTMRPVAKAAGQTIRGKFVHDAGRHQFKVRGEGIKPKLAGLLPGTIYRIT